jgi:hypothetical protein
MEIAFPVSASSISSSGKNLLGVMRFFSVLPFRVTTSTVANEAV